MYDGHGGAEVATYCSQNLPNFIKETEAYKSGELTKALEDAFLGFDASIATKEVMDILKELAGKINICLNLYQHYSHNYTNCFFKHSNALLSGRNSLLKFLLILNYSCYYTLPDIR